MALTFFHTAGANVALFASLMAEIAPDIPAWHAVIDNSARHFPAGSG